MQRLKNLAENGVNIDLEAYIPYCGKPNKLICDS